ncbi:MAG: tetratricopeptide repeat protein [bacterium]
MKRIVFFTIFFVLFTIQSYSFDAGKTLTSANKCYLQKDYDKAADLYSALLKNNYQTADIYFNLGNTYYKKQDWSSAILYYEKAKRLRPTDSDIEMNLKMANLQIIDKIDQVPQVFYARWYDAVSAKLNSGTWAWLSVIFIWLALICFVGFLFYKTPRAKQINFGLGVLSLFFTMFSIIIAVDVNKEEHTHNKGIIFDFSVYVKSSPESDSKNLFIIHNGSKVKIEDRVNNWYKIKLLNGHEGWVETKVLKRI